MPLHGLDFERAQYGPEHAPTEICAFCGRGISGEFYRTNGDLTCVVCAERVRDLLPGDTSQTFWRSVRMGSIVAVGSGLIYLLLFRVMTEHGLGLGTAFGAMGVGYAIGKAMQTAGPGARGRRYQIISAVRTYAAVTVAVMGAMFGAIGLPGWTYLLFLLGPVFLIFAGQVKLSLFLLFFSGIGIRWAWVLLAPHGVQLTGPETVTGGIPGK
jgi:hypothetical protein